MVIYQDCLERKYKEESRFGVATKKPSKRKTKGIYSSTKYSFRDATINYAYKVTPKNTENSTHIKGIERHTGKIDWKNKVNRVASWKATFLFYPASLPQSILL